MTKNLFYAFTILLALCFSACKNDEKKAAYDWSNPVAVLETISNEVSASHNEWTREDWDTAADNVENALRSLPNPLADDETTTVNTAVERMKVYAERHKRNAEGMLSALDTYKKPGAPAKGTIANVPAGLLPATVIQEGGETNVRATASSSGQIVTKIKDGSPIYYTPYSANWCEVYDTNGNKLGFMHTSKVIPASTASASTSGTDYDWLSTYQLSGGEMNGLSKSELRIMRNWIFARHGRRFKSADLQQFFNAQPWYNGYRDEVPANELNAIEKHNIEMIKLYE